MLSKKNLKKREVYAVNHGDHAGQMFIVIQITNDTVNCLAIPVMKCVKVPKEAFDRGRNTAIIEYVETLPKDVYKISEKQYLANENVNN